MPHERKLKNIDRINTVFCFISHQLVVTGFISAMIYLVAIIKMGQTEQSFVFFRVVYCIVFILVIPLFFFYRKSFCKECLRVKDDVLAKGNYDKNALGFALNLMLHSRNITQISENEQKIVIGIKHQKKIFGKPSISSVSFANYRDQCMEISDAESAKLIMLVFPKTGSWALGPNNSLTLTANMKFLSAHEMMQSHKNNYTIPKTPLPIV